jgi:hypothetical protein
MITAQDILIALEENLGKIRDESELDWSRFHRELAPLQDRFTDVTDRNALEMAADSVWQVCRHYPFVKELIRGYSTLRQRKLEAGGTSYEDEMPVREIVNRFQSLFYSLEKIEWLEEGKNRRSEGASRSGAEDANDR